MAAGASLQYSDDDANAAGACCGAQINSVDVRTREQAIQMFAESRDDITLLLARPATQVSFTRICAILGQTSITADVIQTF